VVWLPSGHRLRYIRLKPKNIRNQDDTGRRSVDRIWAKLISAIGGFAWPIAFFSALLLFKSEISKTLGRLRKGTLFGQEIELEASIVELQEKTASATAVVITGTANIQEAPDTVKASGTTRQQSAAKSEEDIQQVLRFATESQGVAVLQLSRLLEAETRDVAMLMGIKLNKLAPLSKVIAELESSQSFPTELASSLRAFWKVRNQVTHGIGDPSGDLRAVEAGISILRALRDIRTVL
jgi:hypothetical protein